MYPAGATTVGKLGNDQVHCSSGFRHGEGVRPLPIKSVLFFHMRWRDFVNVQ